MISLQKKILFLGGAYSQIPAIEYAKRIGLFVITADNVPNNPGHILSDSYFNISTIDEQNILELAKSENIAAISSYASDPSALTAAYVSDQMKLVGGGFEAVNILSDKSKFRDFLRKHDYLYPDCYSSKRIDELIKNYTGKKLVMKPVDSSGSKGISVVNSKTDLIKNFNYAKKFGKSGKVILEEFIDRKGPQIHGEGFVYNGKLKFLCLGDQYFCKQSTLAPISTIIPSIAHDDIMKEAHELVHSVISDIGFITGGINVEIIRDNKDKLYLLEIGARNGGNYMPQLMHYYSGFNIVKANIDSLFNKKITSKECPTKTSEHYAQIILHSDTDTIYNGIQIPKQLENNLVKSYIHNKIGEKVNVYKNSNNVIGVLIIKITNQFEFDAYQDALYANNWLVSC